MKYEEIRKETTFRCLICTQNISVVNGVRKLLTKVVRRKVVSYELEFVCH